MKKKVSWTHYECIKCKHRISVNKELKSVAINCCCGHVMILVIKGNNA